LYKREKKTMRNKWIAFMLLVTALCFTPQLAFASVHFDGPVRFSTSSLAASGFTASRVSTSSLAPGTTLTATGGLAGLGSGDVTITLTASGSGTAMCMNKGGTKAPGRNPIAVNVSGTQSIPALLTKNGRTPFTVTTQPPTMPTAKGAGCPNGNWQVVDVKTSFATATLTVRRVDTGVIVLQQTFNIG
jgi:hypothetical protein